MRGIAVIERVIAGAAFQSSALHRKLMNRGFSGREVQICMLLRVLNGSPTLHDPPRRNVIHDPALKSLHVEPSYCRDLDLS